MARKTAPPPAPPAKRISTRIIDDVFTDELTVLAPRFEVDQAAYAARLWEADPAIHALLKGADKLEAAREALYAHLEKAERAVFALESDLHILEKATVRDCVRVFRSIIGPVNEHRTETSALKILWELARGATVPEKVAVGFLMEFINLFRGISGHSNIYFETREAKKGMPEFLKMEGREAALARSDALDEMGAAVQKYFKKYPSGLDPEVIGWRKQNKRRIMKYFNASEADWENHVWQLKHVIRDAKPLLDLLNLAGEQLDAIEKAAANKIPFGITPYYLSLMDHNAQVGFDHAIRAQVLPPKEYVDRMAGHRVDRDVLFDFMGEHDTSPVDLVTRRYAGIAILKPFNTCAQICVYCQRNWEIDEVLKADAMAGKSAIDEALDWFRDHPSVGDVLITGGDPLVMKDVSLRRLLTGLAEMDHVYRIRFGSRLQVVMPQRFTPALIKLLAEFHDPPRREIALVTHFEHPYEVTPEAMKAVQRLRKAGLSVYNQEVFTIENSRRFESTKLRRDLKSIGVDPYYTFNMKGKEETRSSMVPIARILQERKEEARLLPGLDRTDEPVFNVPKLGKNHLRAGQDHRLVMIMPDGARVYEFHPWEKNITPMPPYNYVDVPIYDYLEGLAARGENIRDYRTIWYYF